MESFGGNDDEDGAGFKELSEELIPIANIGRIMKQVLPPNAKVSKEEKETMQEFAAEFIRFVTSEASDKCKRERRKTMSGDDICSAKSALGFDYYAGAVQRHLQRYSELGEDKPIQEMSNADGTDQASDTDHARNRAVSSTTVTFEQRTDKLF